jgi:hypothetical protein
MDTLSLHVGPEALLAMTDEQRQKAVELWCKGAGIRIWLDDRVVRFELGDGAKGIL